MRWLSLLICAGSVCLGCQTEIITVGPGSSSSGASSSGQGGNGNGGAGGGGVAVSAPPECVQDSDCTLINDCCTCASVPNGETAPECTVSDCFATACNGNGLPNPTAVCRAGHCVVDADCNRAHATCKSLPPECPPGKTIIVVDGCWGGCIDVAECREVENCSQCLDGQACVTSNTMMLPAPHCVMVPDVCNGQVSCACMSENVCGFAMSCDEVSPTELRCLDITTK